MERRHSNFRITGLFGLLVTTAVEAATLDVVPSARWSGDFGLAVAVTDNSPAYVETGTPDEETRYIVRFYFNADALNLSSGSVTLFQALSTVIDPIVTVTLQSDGGSGKELVYTVKTDASQVSTTDIAAPPGWHFLELDWAASTSVGANDGSLTTRLDGVPTAGLTTLDNDQSTVGLARWGAVVLTSSPTGTMWLDDFVSQKTGSVGPILAGSLDLDGNGLQQPLTDGLLFLRSLFGFTGSALISGAVGGGCQYCTAPAIQARLVALQAVLDIDYNQSVGALTDGVLILRHLFGFTGTTLTAGAVGSGSARSSPAGVVTYLESLE